MRDSHPSTADAVIVGGGVMGCSILYNLVARGLRGAVLLEREALASGSTSRSQAILRMHYSNEVTARMAWQSLDVFRDFEQMVGTPSGFVETGYFLIAGDEQREALEANVAMQKGVGIETDVVAPSEAEELAPVLSMRGDEAVAYEPGSGYADPYSVTTGYANRAREMGARVIAGASVTGIEVSGGGCRLSLPMAAGQRRGSRSSRPGRGRGLCCARWAWTCRCGLFATRSSCCGDRRAWIVTPSSGTWSTTCRRGPTPPTSA